MLIDLNKQHGDNKKKEFISSVDKLVKSSQDPLSPKQTEY